MDNVIRPVHYVCFFFGDIVVNNFSHSVFVHFTILAEAESLIVWGQFSNIEAIPFESPHYVSVEILPPQIDTPVGKDDCDPPPSNQIEVEVDCFQEVDAVVKDDILEEKTLEIIAHPSDVMVSSPSRHVMDSPVYS